MIDVTEVATCKNTHTTVLEKNAMPVKPDTATIGGREEVVKRAGSAVVSKMQNRVPKTMS